MEPEEFLDERKVNEEITAVETEMDRMKDRKNKTKSLLKEKDKDAFDVTYNVAKDLRKVSPELAKRLQDKAVEGKEKYYDKNTKPEVRVNLFYDLLVEIDKLYEQAFALMMENIRTIRRQHEEAKRKQEAEKQSEKPNIKPEEEAAKAQRLKDEEEAHRVRPMVEESDPVAHGKRRGLFGKREKEQKPSNKRTIEKVSLDEINQEMDQMNPNKPDYDEEAYRAYNERTRNKAQENEKNYQSSGMEQEQAMQMHVPTYEPSSKSKK